MLPGQRFRLRAGTLGVDEGSGQRRTMVTLPAGSVFRVCAGGQAGPDMVEVEWDGKRILMFAVDIEQRGESIEDG